MKLLPSQGLRVESCYLGSKLDFVSTSLGNIDVFKYYSFYNTRFTKSKVCIITIDGIYFFPNILLSSEELSIINYYYNRFPLQSISYYSLQTFFDISFLSNHNSKFLFLNTFECDSNFYGRTLIKKQLINNSLGTFFYYNGTVDSLTFDIDHRKTLWIEYIFTIHIIRYISKIQAYNNDHLLYFDHNFGFPLYVYNKVHRNLPDKDKLKLYLENCIVFCMLKLTAKGKLKPTFIYNSIGKKLYSFYSNKNTDTSIHEKSKETSKILNINQHLFNREDNKKSINVAIPLNLNRILDNVFDSNEFKLALELEKIKKSFDEN